MRRLAKALCLFALVVMGLSGLASPARAVTRLLPENIDWVTLGGSVQFHLRFDNPDPSPSAPVSGMLTPQAFGAFVQSASGAGRAFDVPGIAPNQFFDVFIEIPLAQLPQNPPNVVPGGGAAGGPCPPDDHWDGNVDITWGNAANNGEVHRHVGRLRVCPGSGCSLIHMVTGCSGMATWSISPPCPGFHVTLLNEDRVTPAPEPVPPGWSGYVCVSADASVPVPALCCFTVQFNCGGSVAVVELCATTCNCNPTGAVPQPGTIDWTTLPGGTVHFHVRWIDPSPTLPTAAGQGSMSSQAFGVFLPDVGPIGNFTLPPIAVGSFFDVFLDVPLSSLPGNPPVVSAADSSGPCPPDRHWNGNVDITWNTAAGGGQVHKHIAEIVVCPGSGAALIHLLPVACPSGNPAPWTVSGLCTGFGATLVNEDFTPAPNPVPPGWSGYVSISAAAVVPVPDTCCFQVTFKCDSIPAVIDLCVITCNCQPVGVPPQPGTIEWSTNPASGLVHFHVRWLDPNPSQPTSPGSGSIHSQMFGAFLPDVGTIVGFTIPIIQPHSFFDVFFDVSPANLPPSATKMLSGGGPASGGNNLCPPDNHWDGNVDVIWSTPAGGGQVNRHYGTVLLNSEGGHGLIHVISGCNSTPGAFWALGPVCTGFTAVLLNMDNTPAPNPLPPGWTGWLSLGAAGTSPGDTCCVDLYLHCAGQNAVVHVCAVTCDWGTAGVEPSVGLVDFGIRNVVPNPTTGAASVSFVLPRSEHATLDVFDAAGHRVRRVADGMYGAGAHSVVWDGRDSRGNTAMPGEYFIRLTTADRSATHKLVLRL